MKTQTKINLSGENIVSKRDCNAIGSDSEMADTAADPIQQSQQPLNEASTVTAAATACS